MTKNSDTLNRLLDKGGQFHPLYGDRLANHLPMALIALHRLGADDARLESFYQDYSKKLNPIPISVENPSQSIDDISVYLGDREKLTDYLHYFQSRIDQAGREVVLKEFLPVLMPGLAASAFHAMIRLAYALEADDDQEIAIALAYWCTDFQTFEISDEVYEENLEQILARLAPMTVGHKFAPGIIVDRMAEVDGMIESPPILLQPVSINLPDIARLVLQAYAAKDNFTLLHTVTSCHALRLIQPYLVEPETGLREYWKALAVAYLSTGLDYQPGRPEVPAAIGDFEDVMAKACKSSNDHVIKIVYSSWQEYQVYQDSLYYYIAERAVA